MGIEEPIIDHTCCNTRSLAAKLSDIISVKDFGAKGDGVTDDTQAIKDAIVYACGKSLLFPHGTYLLKTQDNVGRQIIVELTGNLKIIGHNATLKCGITGTCGTNTAGQTTPCHAGCMMELVSNNGHNLHIDGLNFDGANKSVYGLICRESAIRQSTATIQNCSFVNMFSPWPWVDVTPNTVDDWPPDIAPGQRDTFGGVGSFGNFRESTGVMLYGAWSNVIVDSCFIKNINRAANAGRFGYFGSCGITVIAYSYPGNTYIAPRNTVITNCHIENILNNEPPTSSRNVDADGIKVFGTSGYTSETTFKDVQAIIQGNHFVNCKGRDIKIQIEEVIIQNNTSYMNITPIRQGGARINCQITSGIVSNNTFQFDPTTTGASSFVDDGGSGGELGQGTVISFYDGELEKRTRTITVENNHVFLNVPASTSKILQFFDATATPSFCNSACCVGSGGTPSGCSGQPNPPPDCLCSNVWDRPGFATIRGNKIVGQGKMKFFASIMSRFSGAPFYYTFEDNMISNLETAFLASNGNGSYDFVKISAIGNIHAGPNVKHFVASWDQPPAAVAPGPYQLYSSNTSAINNKNIGLKDANQINPSNPLGRNDPRTFTPKFRVIGNPDLNSGSGISIESVLPTPNTTHTFTGRTNENIAAGKFHIFVSTGTLSGQVVIFRSGLNTIVPIFTGSQVTVSGNTTEPSGSIKLWSNGDGSINMKTASSGITYTLYTFG